jgi:hypothetical protein
MGHSNTHEHYHTHDSATAQMQTTSYNNKKLAVSATLHCLLGCGLGEVAGMAIGAALHWNNLSQMILAIVLGFIAGFALGILPLLKAKYSFAQAFKQVLIAEGLSIAVMETAEALIQIYTPGVMHANLSDSIFWIGMLLSLVAGFIAAYPINYYMVKKGYRHQH